MKKTISIVIAGQVFYIEEDAYTNLENYLNSIKSYFSKMEGSQEIIQDIESRIAEKFIDFKNQSNYEAISSENVKQVIASMGTVADFKEFESEQESKSQAQTEEDGDQQPKVFRRDASNKKIGGVAAGIAHYLEIDVTLVRIGLLLAFLGFIPLLYFGNFIFWAYIICWIAVPEKDFSSNLNKPKIKKFFRDRENKVIGGVIAGISAYTGWDIAILRIISLLLLIPFGFGFLVYLIILLVTPYAESTTDKMQMRGEPITLENIENNLKKNYESLGGDGLISKISDFIFKIAKIVGDLILTILNIIRYFVQYVLGFAFVIVGASLIIATFVIGFSGFSNWDTIDSFIQFGNDFSVNLFLNEFPSGIIWAVLAIFTPISLSFFLGGISLLFNRKFTNRYYGIASMFLFFLGIAAIIFMGSRYSKNFKEEARVNEFNEYSLSNSMIEFSMDPYVKPNIKGNLQDYRLLNKWLEDEYDDNDNRREIFSPSIYLEAYDGDKIQILEFASANGKNLEDAERFAEMIHYQVDIQSDKYRFPRTFQINEKKFRAQNLEIKILVPKGTQFKMNKTFGREINNLIYGLSKMDMENAIWTVDENGGIDCVNFPQITKKYREDNEFHNDMDISEEINR